MDGRVTICHFEWFVSVSGVIALGERCSLQPLTKGRTHDYAHQLAATLVDPPKRGWRN
jgi:hypothetical protein